MSALDNLALRVIPCLDVKDGRTVKGTCFVNLLDAGDPVALAGVYDAEGADELCFLDITASHEARGPLLGMVSQVAECCFIPLTVGGGVRSPEDMQALLSAGADKVAVNTAAVLDPSLINRCAERFGAQCVVAAVDAVRLDGDWIVTVKGGRELTGKRVLDYVAEAASRGAGEILLTSLDRDGTKSGADTDLLRAVNGAVSVPVIASGGIGNPEHAVEAAAAGASAVLAASIFHFGTCSVRQVKEALRDAGYRVRL